MNEPRNTGEQPYLLRFEFAIKADSIETAIERGGEVLECAQDKGQVLHGEVQNLDHTERYNWGTLGQEPFRNASMRPLAHAGEGGR